MSERQKSFGSGAILTAMLIFAITGVMGWVGITASEVPALKATFKSEVGHLNKSLETLNITAKETNAQLKSYTEFHAVNLARITESLVTHKYRITELEKDCKENGNDIHNCQVKYGNK